MTPPKPKKKAEPFEMPRTEKDLDDMMTAVEIHKSESNRIGELVLEEKLTPEQIIDESATNDSALYDVLDAIAYEREEQLVKGDEDLREGRRAR